MRRRAAGKSSAGASRSIPVEDIVMKKTRGGRMTAAKRRAAKAPGGKGPVKKRKAGRRIMST